MKYRIKLDGCREAYPDIEIGLNPIGILCLYCSNDDNPEEKLSGFMDIFKSENPDLECSDGGISSLNPGWWCTFVAIDAKVEYCFLDESESKSSK